MPVSPDMAGEIARRLRVIYEEAEWRALQALAQAVAEGLDDADWVAVSAYRFRAVLDQLDIYLARLDEAAPALIERAVVEAYQAGAAGAVLDLDAAGVTRSPLGGFEASRAVQALVEDQVGMLTGSRARVVRAVADVYQRVTVETTAQMLTGTLSRQEASRGALRKYADKAVTGFVDRAGRRWSLPSYAEMAARTTGGQAAVQGHMDQLRAAGQDLVKVSTSPESCPDCAPWQGRVLSITGGTTGRLPDGVTVAGSLDYARSKGLQHPNCTHTVGLYLPGYSRQARHEEADPDLYETRQQQRAWERSIRRLKRAVLIDESTLGRNHPAARKTRRRLEAREMEFKAWRDAHGRKNLDYRTNLTAR